MSIIRSMRAEDAAKVASLEAEIFSQPWSENAFLDSLRLPDTIFLVAEESGVIQGYIGMYLAVDEGEITNVAVDPACRRRGIGEELLTEMKKCAADHKIARIVLEVRVSNGAVCLYEKQDFPRWASAGDFTNSREKMPELWSVPCNSLWDCTAAQ